MTVPSCATDLRLDDVIVAGARHRLRVLGIVSESDRVYVTVAAAGPLAGDGRVSSVRLRFTPSDPVAVERPQPADLAGVTGG